MRKGILTRVYELVTPSNLLRNAVFCSHITPWNTLPISVILSDPVLLRLRATQDDVISALPYACGEIPGCGIHIRLPYFVYPAVVVFNEAAKSADVSAMSQFVRLLNGECRFVLHTTASGGYAVEFETREMAVALWRAAQKVPFCGNFADVEFGSSLLSGSVSYQSHTEKRQIVMPTS